jgi:hypothetical protein
MDKPVQIKGVERPHPNLLRLARALLRLVEDEQQASAQVEVERRAS